MNLDFCLYKCGRGHRPTELVWMEDDSSCRLVMACHDYQHDCDYIEVEDASGMLASPPKGCTAEKGELLFDEDADVTRILWDVRLKDKHCPYLLEHTMYDLEHEKRLEEWRQKERKRKELIEGRKNNNAEADSKELP